MQRLLFFPGVMLFATASAFLTLRAMDIETCARVIKQQAEHLPGFFVTYGEQQACARRHITITAPVL